jgi:hypothetical protein
MLFLALLRPCVSTSWAADKPAPQHILQNTRADWDLTITTNHADGVYRVGQKLTVTVSAPRRCHLHILNVNPHGDVTVLWPLHAESSNLIEPGQKVVFPDPQSQPAVSFTAQAPAGKELIVCLATTEPVHLKDPRQAKQFADFLEDVAKVSPVPLARLKSFVTTVEKNPTGWAARAIEIETIAD